MTLGPAGVFDPVTATKFLLEAFLLELLADVPGILEAHHGRFRSAHKEALQAPKISPQGPTQLLSVNPQAQHSRFCSAYKDALKAQRSPLRWLLEPQDGGS